MLYASSEATCQCILLTRVDKSAASDTPTLSERDGRRLRLVAFRLPHRGGLVRQPSPSGSVSGDALGDRQRASRRLAQTNKLAHRRTEATRTVVIDLLVSRRGPARRRPLLFDCSPMGSEWSTGRPADGLHACSARIALEKGFRSEIEEVSPDRRDQRHRSFFVESRFDRHRNHRRKRADAEIISARALCRLTKR